MPIDGTNSTGDSRRSIHPTRPVEIVLRNVREHLGNMRKSKVNRVLDDYDLQEIGDQIERRWLGTDGTRYSLRELESWFNRQLLRVAMEDAGMNPLDGEVENLYRLLSDDEVSSGMQTQAHNRLERNGVDVERLENDFVSYQSIRTYLRNYRDVSSPTDEETDRVERETENVQRLKSRFSAVTESKLEGLQKADEIRLGSFRVLADLRVFCETCGSQYAIEEFLERGRCDCD